jgi:epsilon-lactone hydrolase
VSPTAPCTAERIIRRSAPKLLFGWRIGSWAIAAGIVIATGVLGAKGRNVAQSRANDNGAIQVPAFELPMSDLLSTEEQTAVGNWRVREESTAECFELEEIDARRACSDRRLSRPLTEKLKARYSVHVESKNIAGVNTEIIMPAKGVLSRNEKRVLINLHGGAFMYGARFGGQLESIPIAAIGRVRVVSIDYRMAPEQAFPAASEDVAAVYRALLKEYRPKNIGIYGCSAGAVLTAQAVVWFQKEQLPQPGAVGMFCGGAGFWAEGDSGHLNAAILGVSAESMQNNFAFSVQGNPYFKAADRNDPMVFPLRSLQVLARFPPALLISSTRDLALSSVVHTHSQLVKLGVDADLHVWEGLGHSFFINPDLPQSREAYDVIVRFFDQHLGNN